MPKIRPTQGQAVTTRSRSLARDRRKEGTARPSRSAQDRRTEIIRTHESLKHTTFWGALDAYGRRTV